ncbi:MAG: hypothetical protein SFX74_11915 [Fimbriimonadaceae bacterium]|nr:hypothetical protein [Fimbriimonadaceae bacterium]
MFPLFAMLWQSDAKIVDLKDGYVRVETASYSLEVPKGWEVSRETSFGQREFEGSTGRMSAMTANAGAKPDWDRLYQTSLYFIMREKKGKATPYKLGKTDTGFNTCSFSILDDSGFAERRYVLLHNPAGPLLALSVKIPDRKREKELAASFDRMIKSAKFGRS